ncbi:putative hydrolase [[Actinomadura] parvosata subsp. kistnae]|uniref:alpha/beta fold hydrolase n=1 Tax=[Actinomadura] parvosata TaxID=1955412 RepID=UPI000D267437|nr:putative hydrolase [Actinomadura parvosata subsp. kistnae]
MISDYAAVNGVSLYFEQRGSGPAMLFIPGGGVDASHFAQVAELLADEFTTVTYDRRGYFRSRRPEDGTTIAEQADDVAGLLEALDLAPAIVWGGSLGGVILLELISRRADLVATAIVHEPPLFSVLSQGEAMAAEITRQARSGDARKAMEEHASQALSDIFSRLTPGHRERLIANGEPFFGLDVPALTAYQLDAAALAKTNVPVAVVAGAEGPLRVTSQWVADQVGTHVHDLAGGHMPYAVEPQATAQLLRRLSASSQPS